MNRILRRLLPVIAAASTLGTVMPAHASYADSTTGGCSGRGQTNKTGSLGWTETDTSLFGGCNYTFSQGGFVIGGVAYQRGPGWVAGGYAYSDSSSLTGTVTNIVGVHNLCNAGGPCNPPGSQSWATTYN